MVKDDVVPKELRRFNPEVLRNAASIIETENNQKAAARDKALKMPLEDFLKEVAKEAGSNAVLSAGVEEIARALDLTQIEGGKENTDAGTEDGQPFAIKMVRGVAVRVSATAEGVKKSKENTSTSWWKKQA